MFTQELASRLDKRKFQVTILSYRHDYAPIEGVRYVKRLTIPRERMEWLYRNSIVKKLSHWLIRCGGETEVESLILMLFSALFLRRSRFDIVLPFGGKWSFLFASALCRGQPRIVSVGHAGPIELELKKSHLFVALNPFAQEQARQLRPDLPTCVIPNGVDTNRFLAVNRPHCESFKTILCVAAFDKTKRHDLLFDAFTLLEKHVKLVCVGDGPEKQRYADHHLVRQGRIELRAVPHTEIPRCYQEADAFTLPKPEEPFGLVFLEALACGLNVVAHDGPRQRFVLDDVGLYCDVREPQSYARALQKALSTDQRERNVSRAEMFGWNIIVGRYEEVLEKL